MTFYFEVHQEIIDTQKNFIIKTDLTLRLRLKNLLPADLTTFTRYSQRILSDVKCIFQNYNFQSRLYRAFKN